MRGAECVQVMRGNEECYRMVDGVTVVRGRVRGNGGGGRELESIDKGSGSVMGYTPRAWVELA